MFSQMPKRAVILKTDCSRCCCTVKNMLTFRKPTPAVISRFLTEQHSSTFSYAEIGQTANGLPMKGYNNDHNRVQIGQGQADFEKACQALRQWQMFPGGWAWVEPGGASQVEGQTLAMVAKVFGLYWVNACRVVYAIQEAPNATGLRRFGFAYGTLQDHVECGEERFSVEILADGSVWYDLKAFSWPRHWLVRLAYPLARYHQRRFVRQSLWAMKKVVGSIR